MPLAPPTVAAREEAARIRQAIVPRIFEAAGGDLQPLGDVYVGWVAALDAAACPTRYRASGATGWGFPGWSPTLAAAAVGRAALGHHLRHRPQPGGTAHAHLAPDPVGTIRTWMKAASRGDSRAPVSNWVAELTQASDRATLAATAATASRWLGGFIRATGWPLPQGLGIVTGDPDNPVSLRWTRSYRLGPRPGITIASSPDAVLGQVTAAGDHLLVVHRPVARADREIWDRAAFEALAATLASGITPAQVRVTTGDTGENLHVPVDGALLERGAGMAVEVVRQRAIATHRPGDETHDASPSPLCRFCDNLDRCPPGQDWQAATGRWRAGLPVTPATGPEDHKGR